MSRIEDRRRRTIEVPRLTRMNLRQQREWRREGERLLKGFAHADFAGSAEEFREKAGEFIGNLTIIGISPARAYYAAAEGAYHNANLRDALASPYPGPPLAMQGYSGPQIRYKHRDRDEFHQEARKFRMIGDEFLDRAHSKTTSSSDEPPHG